jgi:Holliday junction resolvase RusA-like endonuclease
MEFIIQCIPPKHTAQASNKILKNQNGKMFIGKMHDSKAKQTQTELMWLLSPYQPQKPFVEPLKLEIKWVYPFRKSEAKKNRVEGLPCITRPDCDNLCKLLLDIMTRLCFWVDDSIIYDLHFIKCYSDNPRIEIKIEKSY